MRGHSVGRLDQRLSSEVSLCDAEMPAEFIGWSATILWGHPVWREAQTLTKAVLECDHQRFARRSGDCGDRQTNLREDEYPETLKGIVEQKIGARQGLSRALESQGG